MLGVVFDSVVFPAQNPGKTSMTVMLGGEHNLKLAQLAEPELAARAMQQISYHTPSTPALTNVSVWKQGIPQYVVGHHVRVAEIEELLRLNFPQLYLTGSGLHGVGVNDCTMRSQEVVRQMYAKGGFLASEEAAPQATPSAAPGVNAEVKS